MAVLPRLFPTHTEVDEATATRLRNPPTTGYTVAIQPPATDSLPATLDDVVDGLLELQTDLTRLRNRSPVIAWELRRPHPDNLTLQMTVPTRRLERKLRSHLSTELPDVTFGDGRNGLPVTAGDTVGGGLLTTGRRDWYPLETEFDDPPTNALVGTLHRHSMQQTRVNVQLLFQPIAGHPLRRWWRRRWSIWWRGGIPNT